MDTLLIVDDEPEICSILEFQFQELGYKVKTAVNGSDALRILSANPEIKIVISDVSMPDMSGPDLLSETKKKFPQVKKFIFMTGFSDYTDAQIKQLGANGSIGKPIEFEKLLSLVKD